METFNLNLYVLVYGMMMITAVISILAILGELVSGMCDAIIRKSYSIDLKGPMYGLIVAVLFRLALFYIENP